MKKKTQAKGITLIALVITIILLLILAGVAISMAINSDGLFGKATEATEKWNIKVEEESTEIGKLMDEIEKISPSGVKVTTDFPDGWNENNQLSGIAKSGNEAPVPVPSGFSVSPIKGENTISGGLVIYQTGNTDTTTDGFWTNVENGVLTCQRDYNQYVWIPVADINQMVMCKSNAKGSVCDLKLVNGELQCTNTNHSATATDLCGRLYDTVLESPVLGEPGKVEEIDFSNRAQTWPTDGFLFHEPSILTMYDVDDSASSTYMSIAGITSGKAEDLEANMISDFKQMAISVAKYGGFYVSRYEAGQNGASKKNQKVLVAGDTINMGGQEIPGANANKFIASNTWYGLYNTLKNNTGIDANMFGTHMIWGSQYDQMLNFIGEEAQIGHTRVLNTQMLSGENNADIMKNIYDLEGNNMEWTAETLDREGITQNGTMNHSRKSCKRIKLPICV